jgi:hypothetical protein
MTERLEEERLLFVSSYHSQKKWIPACFQIGNDTNCSRQTKEIAGILDWIFDNESNEIGKVHSCGWRYSRWKNNVDQWNCKLDLWNSMER